MKKKLALLFISVIVAGMSYAKEPVNDFQTGNIYYGFRLIEKRFIQEVNADCLFFIHEQSGAQLIKIAADDPNKLFNIAFKTLPSNSTGVPHIMEHAVLNGSRNFPVKSPFTVLTQGSLNTFLNAMTGSDYTTYPVSSLNNQDYFNLMNVYLDAVLFPNIYNDQRIFLQEGWHYELDSIDGEIVYKGVVFNEMKGAYSSPVRELIFQVNKVLFPDNAYGVCSGGYPSVIPDLTFEEFKDFHSTYYHPSNSYITLYGDADLHRELEFINDNYLSEFQISDAIIELPVQQPFTSMKVAEKPYAVAEDSPVEDLAFLSLNFVAGSGTDPNLRMAMEVLADALVNHQSSPVRLALQEAGLGKNVSAGMLTGKQNLFIILLENANAHEKEQFRKVVVNAMQNVIDNGFDKEMLEGIINRMEFTLREGNTTNKGLMYMMNSYLDWLFNDDPYSGLEFEAPLAHVKLALDRPVLEDLIREYFIDNQHSLLLALYPEPGLETRNAEKERQKLAAYQETLSQEQLRALVKQTNELREYQERQDSPEALATIPMLTLEDISPEINWYELQHKKHNNVPVYHYEAFTNDIFYNYMYFDMKALPQELIPYARLLSAIFRQMGTEKRSFGELENALNINTGSFNSYTESFLKNQSEDDFMAFFVVSGKATINKTDEFFELASELINSINLEDKERLITVVQRHHRAVEFQINNESVNIAVSRLKSYYSKSGIFDDLTRALAYYQFLTGVSNNLDEQIDDLVLKLQQTASLLFNRNNLLVQVSCSEENYQDFVEGLDGLIASLPDQPVTYQQWDFTPLVANEGILSPSQVQYVIQGFDFKKLGYEYDGRMRVLNQILSRVYLQNALRVMGGAYGGWAVVEPSGNFYLASYRDPNLKGTLDNYKGGYSFLENFEADQTEMTRYIIGTISNLDRPRTVNAQGQSALANLFYNRTAEDLKAERLAVLSTTAEDIRQMSKLLADMLAQDAYCVFGSEGKIRENEELFNSVIRITE